jgi:hypothetical protein
MTDTATHEISAVVLDRLNDHQAAAQRYGLETKIQPVEDIPGAAELIVTGHLGAWLQVIARPSKFKSRTAVTAYAAPMAGHRAKPLPAGKIGTHIVVMGASSPAPAVEPDWYVHPEGGQFHVASRSECYIESTHDTEAAAQLEADQRNAGTHYSQQPAPAPIRETWAGHHRPEVFRWYPNGEDRAHRVTYARWMPGGDVELSDGRGHVWATIGCRMPILASPLKTGDLLVDGTRHGIDAPVVDEMDEAELDAVEAALVAGETVTLDDAARQGDLDWGLGRPHVIAGHPDDTQLDLLAELDDQADDDQADPCAGCAGDGCFRCSHTGIEPNVGAYLRTQHLRGHDDTTTVADDLTPPAPSVIVIPCGAKKLDHPAPAGDMYIGSYHRAARRAAEALAQPGTRIVILSALYGLLDLNDVIEPYELRLGDVDAITAGAIHEQARQMGIEPATGVIILAGKMYGDLAATVWPDAARPLAGTRGMGEQLARFAAIANPPQAPDPEANGAHPLYEGAQLTRASEYTWRGECDRGDCTWPGVESRSPVHAVNNANDHARVTHSARTLAQVAAEQYIDALADNVEPDDPDTVVVYAANPSGPGFIAQRFTPDDLHGPHLDQLVRLAPQPRQRDDS